MTDRNINAAVVPLEGWHVLHLFYKIEHGQWSLLSPEERITAKTNMTELVQEIRATPDTQLLIFSMVSPKADIGFMLLTPDLHTANAFEKRLTLSLGPDILTPTYSFLSLTEESEYMTTSEEYGETLQKEGVQTGLRNSRQNSRSSVRGWRSIGKTSCIRCCRFGKSSASIP